MRIRFTSCRVAASEKSHPAASVGGTETWRYGMGRASKRKKAQRQAGGPNLRRIKQDARSPAATRGLPFNLDAMVQFAGERVRRRAIALQAWLGDTEPTSAETPSWPQGSLGHRLL